MVVMRKRKVDELSLSYNRPVLFIRNPKSNLFSMVRLRKRSSNICLSFKLVIEKRFQIKITGAVKKLGKIWHRES